MQVGQIATWSTHESESTFQWCHVGTARKNERTTLKQISFFHFASAATFGMTCPIPNGQRTPWMNSFRHVARFAGKQSFLLLPNSSMR
jgi:hypothetical protein